MSRPPNLCVYCGQKGRSKEHYWGNWLIKHLPQTHSNTKHTVLKWNHRTGMADIQPGPLSRQGNIRKQQIKAPCETCNNGWMRKTNEAAKPIIIKLIDSGPFELNRKQANLFATWAVMFSMTYEFADIKTMVTQQIERAYLMDHQTPPNNWAVLIGLFGGVEWQEIHNHRALREGGEEGMADQAVAQCNTFTLGKTVVVTLSGAPAERELLRLFSRQHSLKVAWPYTISRGGGRKPILDYEMWEIAKYV